MRFFYDSEILCEIGTLERFSHLQELCLNGGDFNKDPLRQLIENTGHNWTKLELNHVDNIGKITLHVLPREFHMRNNAHNNLNDIILPSVSHSPYPRKTLQTISSLEVILTSLDVFQVYIFYFSSDLIFQTDTPWYKSLSAVQTSQLSHSPPAHSSTTELYTGHFYPLNHLH